MVISLFPPRQTDSTPIDMPAKRRPDHALHRVVVPNRASPIVVSVIRNGLSSNFLKSPSGAGLSVMSGILLLQPPAPDLLPRHHM
jgi:hypothetical protein